MSFPQGNLLLFLRLPLFTQPQVSHLTNDRQHSKLPMRSRIPQPARTRSPLASVAVALLLASAFRGRAQQAPTFSGATALAQVRKKIKDGSQVPLRLPSYVPNANDPDHPVFLTLQKLSPKDYLLLLAFDKDCQGQHVCEVGTMQGSSEPLQHDYNTTPQPVLLKNGSHANYVSFQCGSYCGDGELWWSEGRWNYSIRMKAGNLKELLQLANSAIATGKN